MLRAKVWLTTIVTLTCIALIVIGMTPSSAFAKASSHSFASNTRVSRTVRIPLVSGGGCTYSYQQLIYVYSCVSDGNNQVLPDVYISPNPSVGGNDILFSSCNLNIYTWDSTQRTKTTSGGHNCIDPLQQNYQGKYVGTSVGAIRGHNYYTEAVVTYNFHATNYSTDISSPLLFA